MGFEKQIGEEDCKIEEEIHHNGSICLHSLSNLSRISPLVCVYLLKEVYIHGTLKATLKFHVLQEQFFQALQNDPQPGPASFVVRCLYVLPLFGPQHAEGFSHLLISCIRHLQTVQMTQVDSSKAKSLAVQLFLDVLRGIVVHEERILVKLIEFFDFGLKDIGDAICGPEVNADGLDRAKACVEQYISGLIKRRSYMTAVTLLKRFPIHQSRLSSEPLLLRMMEDRQFIAAETWATFMGKPTIRLLVQKYLDMEMLKNAYDVIKKNNLKLEFPDAYRLHKESLLKKLAKKGCWDIAEARTNNDRQLVEYLVHLAMKAGYTEKVDELCERHSLKIFVKEIVPEASLSPTRYLHLTELFLEDTIWVDNVNALLSATSHIEGCKVVGIDCEWKPNYEKGSKPNKVSIMQIASEKKVFILDVIQLFADEPKSLDGCLKRIFCSPRILKLGYDFHCDLHQLSHSYEDLECFKYYEMLLDIQKLFRERKGGLSDLAKRTLGAGLDKTRRNSNWEQRPLSQNQIEYAALDAVVLIHIFHRVCGQPQFSSIEEDQDKIEWKSHIVSQMGKTNVPRDATWNKRKL
ncbi:uncharacterized protein LOC143853094 isoform X2 [Tasmannia lanceolata]|uniref:uncharacterized protein LOC143853094 isoform X2 n=1 Tax=Tasmannia lanceolata TaxID=3420 RepID=UPI004063E7E5